MPLRHTVGRSAPGEHRGDTSNMKVGVRRADQETTRKMRARSAQAAQPTPGEVDPDATTKPMSVFTEEAAPTPEVLSVHERLLLAARDRFSSEGYENATTAAIARQAGTSESQLVKHFGSKEGLLEAIFDEAWAMLQTQCRQAAEDQTSPVARLLTVVDVVTRAVERDRKLRSLILLEGRRIRKNGYDVVISSGFRSFLSMVDDLFRLMQAQGDLVPDIHLEAVRSAWMGAIEALLRDQLLAELMGYPATFNRKQMRRTANTVLMAFLTPRAQRMVHALAD